VTATASTVGPLTRYSAAKTSGSRRRRCPRRKPTQSRGAARFRVDQVVRRLLLTRQEGSPEPNLQTDPAIKLDAVNVSRAAWMIWAPVLSSSISRIKYHARSGRLFLASDRCRRRRFAWIEHRAPSQSAIILCSASSDKADQPASASTARHAATDTAPGARNGDRFAGTIRFTIMTFVLCSGGCAHRAP